MGDHPAASRILPRLRVERDLPSPVNSSVQIDALMCRVIQPLLCWHEKQLPSAAVKPRASVASTDRGRCRIAILVLLNYAWIVVDFPRSPAHGITLAFGKEADACQDTKARTTSALTDLT
jgi:hypothetical protein